MATVLQLIADSLREIGVLPTGSTPSASEASDALRKLNRIVEALALERINVYSIRRDTHALQAGVQDYTIGAGGTFNATRPLKIENANIIQPNGLQTPLDLLAEPQWSAIPEKNVSATTPEKLYNDGAHPLSMLRFWPKPSGAPTLELFTWQQIAQFAAVGDPVALPPGYERFLVFNLAVELAAEYGREVPASVAAIAGQSRQAVAMMNVAAGLPAPQQPATA